MNLNRVKNEYKRAINNLPRKLGAAAVEYVHQNFRVQGYVNRGVEKWAPRKRTDTGRAILVKSGALRRDVRIRQTGRNFVMIGTSLAYAAIHNTGGTIRHPGGTAYYFDKAGNLKFIRNTTAEKMKRPPRRTGAHNIPIPRRQFMPTRQHPSARLNTIIKETIQRELKKIV